MLPMSARHTAQKDTASVPRPVADRSQPLGGATGMQTKVGGHFADAMGVENRLAIAIGRPAAFHRDGTSQISANACQRRMDDD